MTTNNQPTKVYWEAFIGYVYDQLGGMEMAGDFFKRHPEQRRKMRNECKYHFNKGGKGTAEAGASIYFKVHVTPIIRADRAYATKYPIPRKRP